MQEWAALAKKIIQLVLICTYLIKITSIFLIKSAKDLKGFLNRIKIEYIRALLFNINIIKIHLDLRMNFS